MKRIWPFAMILIVVAVTPIPSFTQAPQQSLPDAAESCKRLGSVKNATALQTACELTLSTTRLPDYLCQQSTALRTRADRDASNPEYWEKTRREVVAQVRYVDGTESYTDIKVDGVPTDRPMVDVSGATGQFSSVLQALFDPNNHAEFTFSKEGHLNSIAALRYQFHVKRENNKNLWFLRTEGKVTYPGYSGQLWVHKDTGQPMRLEMRSTELPPEVWSLELKVSVEYAVVAIGDGSKLVLPIKADTFTCDKLNAGCLINSTTFSNFRKFKAEHRILPTE